MARKRRYEDVKIIDKPSIKTGRKTVDEFLSTDHGFQLGNLILMTGTSGSGKTTFCKLIQKLCPQDSIFHALESLASSVARQTKRIKIVHKNAYITDEEDYPDFDKFMEFLYEDNPTFVMVDSLQHAVKQLKKDKEDGDGNVIKKGMNNTDAHHHVLDSLYSWKDKTQGVVILICQLNKDNSFSGPSGMLFDADVRVHLEYNLKTGERTMETLGKNRMGQLGSIYYEFTSDDSVMKFYTEEEWDVIKKDKTFLDLIHESFKKFASAYKNHENFKKFRKEFDKELKSIQKINDDDYAILSQLILAMGRLETKYFKL